jgi:hypothetical protein
VAALFAAAWIWPTEPKLPVAQAASSESSIEQTIRIKSARRWPEKIVFDTNQPTIAPPPAAMASEPPAAPRVAANAPLDARADLKAAAPPPKRQAKLRRQNPRQDYYATRSDGWHEASQDPRNDAWHDPWHDPRRRNTFAFAGPMAPSWSFGRW